MFQVIVKQATVAAAVAVACCLQPEHSGQKNEVKLCRGHVDQVTKLPYQHSSSSDTSRLRLVNGQQQMPRQIDINRSDHKRDETSRQTKPGQTTPTTTDTMTTAERDKTRRDETSVNCKLADGAWRRSKDTTNNANDRNHTALRSTLYNGSSCSSCKRHRPQ